MKTEIFVQNVKCGGCGTTISKRLQKLEGVSEVMVDPAEGKIILEHQEEAALDQAPKILKSLGYPLAEVSNSLRDKAKSFVSCGIGRLDKA
ncbi:Copper chaperone CopZ [Robiginitalea myxolifaciens]|uniref:Copper chaperone CopZ n=1 Tax=Robiginitalea myxolifaciens TaxID=400055 RepID=A0A1I6GBY6_9FLAO|nr:heavy metal-associated domain-containing protein [Robiginitalea myxolifaciens]SFR39724.1 Copper chaperone CopZ [Robiginitalea myxolifaciens]